MPEAAVLPKPDEVKTSEASQTATENKGPESQDKTPNRPQKFAAKVKSWFKPRQGEPPPNTHDGLTNLASGKDLPPITEAGLTPATDGGPLETQEGKDVVQGFDKLLAHEAPQTAIAGQPEKPTDSPIVPDKWDQSNPNAHLAPEQRYVPPTPDTAITSDKSHNALKETVKNGDWTGVGYGEAAQKEFAAPSPASPDQAPQYTAAQLAEAQRQAKLDMDQLYGVTPPVAKTEAQKQAIADMDMTHGGIVTSEAAVPAPVTEGQTTPPPTAEQTLPITTGEAPKQSTSTEATATQPITPEAPQTESTTPEKTADTPTTPETARTTVEKSAETNLTHEQQKLVDMAKLGQELQKRSDKLTPTEQQLLLETAAKNPDMITALNKALENNESSDVIKAAVENPTTENMQAQENTVVEQITALEKKDEESLSKDEKEKLGFLRGVLKVLKVLGIAVLASPVVAAGVGIAATGAVAVGVGKLASN